jgi:hypothetical protein
MKYVLALLLSVLATATPGASELPSLTPPPDSGSLKVQVRGPDGRGLPGTALCITLSSPGTQNWHTFFRATDSLGRARFPNVPAGQYLVLGNLAGFDPVRLEQAVIAGSTTEITLLPRPSVSSTGYGVDAASDSPVIDSRTLGIERPR